MEAGMRVLKLHPASREALRILRRQEGGISTIHLHTALLRRRFIPLHFIQQRSLLERADFIRVKAAQISDRDVDGGRGDVGTARDEREVLFPGGRLLQLSGEVPRGLRLPPGTSEPLLPLEPPKGARVRSSREALRPVAVRGRRPRGIAKLLRELEAKKGE